MSRTKIPNTIQTELVTKSKRRCALCFGLNNNLDEKKGQIAHINNNNNSDNRLDNLVWLCLEHHDQFDSQTSQSKNYIPREVKNYRNNLYQKMEQFYINQNKPQDARIIIESLSNLFLEFIPYRNLLIYIEQFPENFSMNILVQDMWNRYKTSNPHIYPFYDKFLNQKLDTFFSYQNEIEKIIVFQYERDNGLISSFENIFNDSLKMSNLLSPKETKDLYMRVNEIKPLYIKSYNELTSYFRENYPDIKF